MATLYDADGNEIEIDDALLGGGQGDPGPQSNSDFAALRKQTQATKKAEALAAAKDREVAFLRAGIDPEAKEGMVGYFAKGYEGEMTPEAIKAAATAAGIIQAPAASAEEIAQQQANQTALEAQGRVASVAGAQMAQPTADQQTRKAMEDAYQSGGIEALTEVLQAQGIPRVTL